MTKPNTTTEGAPNDMASARAELVAQGQVDAELIREGRTDRLSPERQMDVVRQFRDTPAMQSALAQVRERDAQSAETTRGSMGALNRARKQIERGIAGLNAIAERERVAFEKIDGDPYHNEHGKERDRNLVRQGLVEERAKENDSAFLAGSDVLVDRRNVLREPAGHEPKPASELAQLKQSVDLSNLLKVAPQDERARADFAIAAVESGHPSAPDLLEHLALGSTDPLHLQSALAKLRGRSEELAATRLFADSKRLAQVAELYELERVRRGLPTLRKMFEQRPGEIELMRSALRKLLGDE